MAVTRVLRRFDTYVYKDKNPPSDLAQIPAVATIDLYRQGATIVPGQYIEIPYNYFEDIAINVWNPGNIVVGDDVLVDANSARQLRVGQVDPTTIWVKNLTTPGIFVVDSDPPGDVRLMPTGSRPLVYQDPTGQTSTGQAFIATDAASGRAGCYLRAYRFDYIVTGAGFSPRFFFDAIGSFVLRN